MPLKKPGPSSLPWMLVVEYDGMTDVDIVFGLPLPHPDQIVRAFASLHETFRTFESDLKEADDEREKLEKADEAKDAEIEKLKARVAELEGVSS